VNVKVSAMKFVMCFISEILHCTPPEVWYALQLEVSDLRGCDSRIKSPKLSVRDSEGQSLPYLSASTTNTDYYNKKEMYSLFFSLISYLREAG
jgi:hypothetical protein